MWSPARPVFGAALLLALVAGAGAQGQGARPVVEAARDEGRPAATVAEGARGRPEFRCASVQPSASRSPAYARVGAEERCEGYFEQTVSQPFVELLSLTRHRPDAQPGSLAGPWRIRAAASRPSQLVIQPVRPSPFYRVDAALAADAAIAWNPAPMLASTGLKPGDLGFLARSAGGDGSVPTVVPVSVSWAPEDPVQAYAVLRVSTPVASIAARRYRLGAPDAAADAWRELPGPPLYAWETVVLPIALPGDGLETRIDVRAVASNGRPLPLLQFAVAGR
jgi:hypothetical protein